MTNEPLREAILVAATVPPGAFGNRTRAADDQAGDRRGRRKAVALKYKRGRQRAPVVTASGRGEVAERIIRVAQEHGIYIQPDPDLVEVLAQLDLGAAIPPQLYYAVAEILAFVYKLNSAQATTSSLQGLSS